MRARFGRREHFKRIWKYASVSVISTLVTQVVLFLTYHVWTVGSAMECNVIATVVASVPAYYLNRSWTWGKRGRSQALGRGRALLDDRAHRHGPVDGRCRRGRAQRRPDHTRVARRRRCSSTAPTCSPTPSCGRSATWCSTGSCSAAGTIQAARPRALGRRRRGRSDGRRRPRTTVSSHPGSPSWRAPTSPNRRLSSAPRLACVRAPPPHDHEQPARDHRAERERQARHVAERCTRSRRRVNGTVARSTVAADSRDSCSTSPWLSITAE